MVAKTWAAWGWMLEGMKEICERKVGEAKVGKGRAEGRGQRAEGRGQRAEVEAVEAEALRE
jgi:hypothetical protein